MRSPLLPTAALAACFLTASCASSPQPATAPPKPLPSEYAVRCPALPPLPGEKADNVIAALKDLYDLYGICAGRLVDLLDWIDGGQQ
jgi:hypothetical protein